MAVRLTSSIRRLIDQFPRLASLYRNLRDQMGFMKEPIQTPWGFKLAGNDAMALGSFEPVETELVRKLLQDVDVFVNVGANIGYYCCHALSLGIPVMAFEPMQHNVRHLLRNIRSNGWHNAEVYPVALSNCVAIIDIFGGDTGASVVKGWANIPDSYVTLAPTSTMDILLGDRLRCKRALILVDIEGAEQAMLEGASRMLHNDPKPIWIVEIVTRDHQPQGIAINPNLLTTFEMFFNLGYQAFHVDRDMLPVSLDDVRQAARGARNLGTHNFLFREAE
jgi:FkbM family methyltransferase